jgi:4-hydroxybenzoate polyprenyltransferase
MRATVQSPLARRATAFALERFSPLVHGPLVVALVAPVSIVTGVVGVPVAAPAAWSAAVVAGLVVAFILFALRAFDDAKDGAVDRIGRPDRPVPRGLVSESELHRIGDAALLAALIVALALPVTAIVASATAAAFVWLAGRDALAPESVRRNPLLYAVVHSPAVPLLALVAWWANPGATWQSALAGVLVLTLGVALCLELTRKIRVPAEERRGVESYSSALGASHAIVVAAAALGLAAFGAYWIAIAIDASAWWLAMPVGAAVVAGGVAAVNARAGVARARSVLATVALGLLLWPATLGIMA